MPKKIPPFRIAPLQRIVAEPIDDPAEQAAIDKMRERLKRKKRDKKKPPTGRGKSHGTDA